MALDGPHITIERKINNLFTGEGLLEVFSSRFSNPLAELAYDHPGYFGYFNREVTFSDIIEDSFRILSQRYRSEYFYKNVLARKLFLSKANPAQSIYINEFKVGKSIADVVIIDKTSKVFEIKTELDSPERLFKQLADYREIFEEIYLVTSIKLASKYERLLPPGIGLLVVTERGALRKLREARTNYSFNFDVLYNTLRKPEYTEITRRAFDALPQAPEALMYKACRRLLRKIDMDEFYPAWKQAIKSRKINAIELISSPSIPDELKHWCLAKNLSEKKLTQLINSLITPIKNQQPLCTYRL